MCFYFSLPLFALSIYLRFPFGGVIARIARPQISLVDVLASPIVAIFTSHVFQIQLDIAHFYYCPTTEQILKN